jgi:hypothetical protein
MSSPNPISNSSAIRADKVEVGNPLKRKYETLGESIVGLAPEDLNSIELLAQAIDNDPNYFQTVAAGLTAKANKSDVDADPSLLNALVNTKARSSALTSATAALQSQVDTKASSSALASLSSTEQKQDALLQVPVDEERGDAHGRVPEGHLRRRSDPHQHKRKHPRPERHKGRTHSSPPRRRVPSLARSEGRDIHSNAGRCVPGT